MITWSGDLPYHKSTPPQTNQSIACKILTKEWMLQNLFVLFDLGVDEYIISIHVKNKAA